MEESYFSTAVASRFGSLQLIWKREAQQPRVRAVLLPGETLAAPIQPAQAQPSGAQIPPAIADLAERLEHYLRGEPVDFTLDLLDLDQCPPFQRRVLIAEHGIPRGWVSTYSRIAHFLDAPKAARAVGNALGRNPFPILIPCHRAVRTDGGLGGYRGGLPMKRALLEMEGIPISSRGSVLTDRFYY